MIMTKIKALELSIELWEWLTDNPDKEKDEHPTLPVSDWLSDCALCQYNPDGGCNRCPMAGGWPSAYGTCENCGDSAYEEWTESNLYPYDRSFLAAVLVEAFKKRLAELQEE